MWGIGSAGGSVQYGLEDGLVGDFARIQEGSMHVRTSMAFLQYLWYLLDV